MERILGWSEKHFNEARSCGYLYFRQGSFEIAQKFFQMLVAFDPENKYDQLMLGACFLELEAPDQAILCFNHVLDLEPDHHQALFLRLKALLAMQENLQAQDMARMLLQTPYRGKVLALSKTYHLRL